MEHRAVAIEKDKIVSDTMRILDQDPQPVADVLDGGFEARQRSAPFRIVYVDSGYSVINYSV